MKLADFYPHAPALRERAAQRFWEKVDESGGKDACWPWTAYRAQSGYGHFHLITGPGEGRDYRAHRVAYMLANGELPDAATVCHSCDNRPCCNPAHLWTGTQADNMRDCCEKGRQRTVGRPGESNPRAKLDWEQVRDIRKRHAANEATGLQLAAEYGMAPSSVRAILAGRVWKEVA